jgi:hypothetical protein
MLSVTFLACFQVVFQYEVSNPNMVINLLCRSFGNAFISTSTTMSSIEQYLKVTSPVATRSQTK